MTTWLYNEQDAENPIEITESQILREYFPYWLDQMVKAGQPDCMMTPMNCIDDWVLVHWAWKKSMEG